MTSQVFSEAFYKFPNLFSNETHKEIKLAPSLSPQLKESSFYFGKYRSIHAGINEAGTITTLPFGFFSNLKRYFTFEQNPELIQAHAKLALYEKAIYLSRDIAVQKGSVTMPPSEIQKAHEATAKKLNLILGDYEAQLNALNPTKILDVSNEKQDTTENPEKQESKALSEKINKTHDDLKPIISELKTWQKEIHDRKYLGYEALKNNFINLNECFKKANQNANSLWITVLKAINYCFSFFGSKPLSLYAFDPIDTNIFEEYIFSSAMQATPLEKSMSAYQGLTVSCSFQSDTALPTADDFYNLELGFAKECFFIVDGQKCSLQYEECKFKLFYHDGPMQKAPENPLYSEPFIIEDKFGDNRTITQTKFHDEKSFNQKKRIPGCLILEKDHVYTLNFSKGKKIMTIDLSRSKKNDN